MVAYGKRRVLPVLSAGTMLFLMAFAVGCSDAGPTPTLERIEATPIEAPTAIAQQEAPAIAQVPASRSGQPMGTREPVPAAKAVPPTPTSTPAPKPAGYLHGAEHGIALPQTTRRPSETRDGWVDITLALATLKFGGEADNREHRVEANSMCYVNRQLPDDCLFIAWGSEEQFEAELRASHPVSDSGLPFQTDTLVVTFEIAANANSASLYFGDQHKIILDLRGDETTLEPSVNPVVGPTPRASSGQSAGYFVDDDYGIAITGVRRGPSSANSPLSRVEVNVSIIFLGDGKGVAPEFRVGADDNSDICLGYSPRLECLKVRWGPKNQFQAAPLLEDEIVVEWPLGRGLPISFGLLVPNSAKQGAIEFGQHRIPIDLKGMVGETPAYDYRLHYQELPVGSTLYDSNRKTVVLEKVRQEMDTGGVTLVFSARNDSEATDFAPVIDLTGSRVSQSGRFLEGNLYAAADWAPQSVRVEGKKLAPGQSNVIEHTVPRFAGKEQGYWQSISYSPRAEERPDGVVLQLTVSDSLTDAGIPVSEVGYVRYDRLPEDSDGWTGTLLWRQTSNAVWSSPAVSGGVVYVGSDDHHLYAIGRGHRRPAMALPDRQCSEVLPGGVPRCGVRGVG